MVGVIFVILVGATVVVSNGTIFSVVVGRFVVIFPTDMVVVLLFTNLSFCVLFTALVVLLKGVVVFTNDGLVVRFCDWLCVVVWIIICVVVCAFSVVVDRFNRRFDRVVCKACVDVGGRCVVVDGYGLDVVVVVDCCVDICIGKNVDVEKIMLFVVLTTGDIDVAPMVSTFVVVCGSCELHIYNVGSIVRQETL